MDKQKKSEYDKERHRANKEAHALRCKKYREENKEKLNAQKSRYYQQNADMLKERSQKYYSENKQKVKETRQRNSKKYLEYRKNRRAGDLNFRITENLRSRLNLAIKRSQKSGSAVSDLGCDIDFFKAYIAEKFTEGMSWSNYGEWHLDHVRPLASFNLSDRNEFLQAAHYSNYQPLWAVDNLKKGSKWPSIPRSQTTN